jgi:hypothetical protein
MRYVHTSKKGKQKARHTEPKAAPSTLSEALVSLAGPLLELFRQPTRGTLLKSVLSLATLAWNEGNPHCEVPPREAIRVRDRLAQEFGSAWGDVVPYYQDLIRTRRERFADDRRIITDFRLEHGADGKWQVYVAGGEPPEEPKAT